MSDIINVVRDDLEGKNVSPQIIEKVPSYVRRAIIALHKKGALPPRIIEERIEDIREERRDGNGNVLYEFFFLPEDYIRLDKFSVYHKDQEDNRSEATYQRISHDMLFDKRPEGDVRNFFTIFDYHIGDEQTRKVLVLDPWPDKDSYIELRYFPDGADTPLENITQRYWEPVITKVHEILGIKSKIEADKAISEESANWRNQQGKDSHNDTHVRSKVKFPFGKTR